MTLLSLYSKICGTVESFFQIGGLSGPQFKSNAGNIDARNAGDTAFVNVRGAIPAGDNDFVTKAYVDKTANKPILVSLQFSGDNALPANTGTEQWYVVTTSGENATIGQILWDDGSGKGTVAVIPAVTGNEIVTTVAFSGGTISLSVQQNYVWSGTAWIAIVPNVSGAVFCIRLPITNAASQSSVTTIPANAIIHDARLDVVTPYLGGGMISIGIAGTVALFMATTDNVATIADIYQVQQDTSVGGSAAALLVTVTGAPSAGAGFAIIFYSVPNQ